jgi:hypothetical protein
VVSDGFALIIGSVGVIVSGVLLWWLVFLELPHSSILHLTAYGSALRIKILTGSKQQGRMH